MNSVPDRQARDGVVRWIDEGPNVLRALLGILNDYNRLRGTAETAERECERLREEVSQLRADNDRFRREMEGIAEALSKLMNDLLLRSRDPQQGNRRPSDSRRGGKITYLLRQTQPGVTELVEIKR